MSSVQEQKSAAENAALRAEVAQLRGQLNAMKQARMGASLVSSAPESYYQNKVQSGNSDGKKHPDMDSDSHLTFIILGASGDLAVKKTYPALFALHRHHLTPEFGKFSVVGYARSKIEPKEKFIEKISSKFPSEGPKASPEKKKEFLSACWYVSGQYDSDDDVRRLDEEIKKVEEKSGCTKHNRIFYLAIPPTAFIPAARTFRHNCMSSKGWTRIIVEKPFGRDSESSDELGRELAKLYSEDQIYRIDHYLGKEMVQNLMVLRFANRVFEPLWNRDHVSTVMITFKENFGTEGRGGYFDNFGIIRDVMQNHLLQMLSILAMEPPLSLSAEDVRDEKVKLLRAITPITVEDTVTGQYTASADGKEPGYKDDKDVPQDSVTPTFAATVLHINNTRWMGTPFIMKAGKGLNEKKGEIRIQFKTPVNTLFEDVSPNELVLKVTPDEAVYLKMTTKQPGLEGGNRHTELDLTYKQRFKAETEDMPEAYERLVLDVMRGDHNLFVRADELAAAWNIFTPLLHQIEKQKAISPIPYQFGSRGPEEADRLVQKYGYIRTTKYRWEEDRAEDKANISRETEKKPHMHAEEEEKKQAAASGSSSGNDKKSRS